METIETIVEMFPHVICFCFLLDACGCIFFYFFPFFLFSFFGEEGARFTEGDSEIDKQKIRQVSGRLSSSGCFKVIHMEESVKEKK